MIRVIWSDKFVNRYKKWARRHSDLTNIFEDKILLFSKEPFHPSLKTHSLRGKLKDVWSMSINYEHRLTFRFEENNTKAILINIGAHDEVY